MKYILTIIILFIVSASFSQNKHKQLKAQLSWEEKKNYRDFIKIKNVSVSSALVGKNQNISFSIINAASATTFKDFRIKIVQVSKTGAEIKTDYEFIYEYIAPKNYKNVTIKVKGTAKTHLYYVSLESAKY